jgi:hypothetical protein
MTSGTLPVCMVEPEEFPVDDISELLPPPPQAARAAAAAAHIAYLNSVNLMTYPP